MAEGPCKAKTSASLCNLYPGMCCCIPRGSMKDVVCQSRSHKLGENALIRPEIVFRSGWGNHPTYFHMRFTHKWRLYPPKSSSPPSPESPTVTFCRAKCETMNVGI